LIHKEVIDINKKIKWKYEIGQHITNETRDTIITNREIRHKKSMCNGKIINRNDKWYECLCNQCNQKHWVIYYDVNKNGCPYCTSKIVKKGINDIATKRPDLLCYLFNKDDGFKYSVGSQKCIDCICPICKTHKKSTPLLLSRQGFSCDYCNSIGVKRPDLIKYFKNKEDSYKHFCHEKKKVELVCPDCNRTKKMSLGNLVNYGFVCDYCSCGISVPERFIISLLKQLDVDYIYQLNKSVLEWCDKFRYDFYIPDQNIIIETHGGQHYFNAFGMKYEQVHENDIVKEKLARNYVKEYITLDCRKSDIEWLKNSILKSKLNEIYNLIDIDWDLCYQNSLNSIVKEICLFYMSNLYLSNDDICKKYGINYQMLRRYLMIGNQYGWCNYNDIKSKNKHGKKGFAIDVYKDDQFLFTYKNAKLLAQNAQSLLGIKLYAPTILDTCRCKRSEYKGYVFKFSNMSGDY